MCLDNPHPPIITANGKAAVAKAAAEEAAFEMVVEKAANETSTAEGLLTKTLIAQQITVIYQLLRIQLLHDVSDDVKKQAACAKNLYF